MRTLEGSIAAEKNDSHYIPLQSNTEGIAVNTNAIHQTIFTQNSCRPGSVGEPSQLCPDSWGADLLVSSGNAEGGNVEEGETVSMGREQLTEEDRQIAAALMAVQFVQQNERNTLIHEFGQIAKAVSEGRVVQSSSDLLDTSIRMYQDHEGLRDTSDLVPNLLPPLPPLKRVQDNVWYQVKNNSHYEDAKCIDETLRQLPSDECEIDLNATPVGQGNRQQPNKKSLPHKKRISRKLKKNLPQNSQQVNDDMQEAVDISLSVQDDVMSSNQIGGNAVHTERAVFICQLCGDYYGEDQIQFFHHLKQHYEPNTTQDMVMQSTIGSMQHNQDEQININKIDENIVIEGNQLPESLVELSLEGSGVSEKQTLYSTHKLANYINVEKSLFVTNDKDGLFQTDKVLFEQSQKQHTYTTVERTYSCQHCNKAFKRHRQYETHLREYHSKIDEISEFSEPEDLMEGIHVVVEPDNEEYLQDDLSSDHSNTVLIQTSLGGHDQYILPHLTIDNGHAHQAHLNSKWHIKEILGMETEKNVDSNITSDDLSADGVDSVEGIEDQGDGRMVCSLCGMILENKNECLGHSTQCQMQLKENLENFQHMMNDDVDVSDVTGVVEEEIIDDSNLIVDENAKDDCFSVCSPNAAEEDSENSREAGKEGKKEVANPPMYKCKQCSKEFKHRNSLIYHEQSHQGTRPFLCEICNKRFYSASALRVHTRLHTGLKPYKCDDCGRMFRQWGDLKYHCISLHSNMKQHQCEYCGKDFARKYSLIVHRRIHTGEKNYKCEFCDKRFRASSYLQNHRKIHTGEKPHTCNECGKAFRMKGDMRRHKRTHSKESVKSKTCIKKETTDDSKETASHQTITVMKVKQKAFTNSTVAPKKELKQEMRDIDHKDSSLSNDDRGDSPHSDTVNPLQEEDKASPNCQMDTTIYSWPVFIT